MRHRLVSYLTHNKMYRFIILNGQKYAIQQGSYVRKWTRQFTATLSANIVELNFVDKGPGIQAYDMTLIIATWSPGSIMYTDGITQTMTQQIAALEALYLQRATSFTFIDPYGNPPTNGLNVYFTNLTETIPNYSTVQKPYTLIDIELIAAQPAIS